MASGGVAYVMLPYWNFFSHNNARTEIRFNDESHSVEVFTQHAWEAGEEVHTLPCSLLVFIIVVFTCCRCLYHMVIWPMMSCYWPMD